MAKVVPIPFVGQAYVDQPLSAQDTVNWIPDMAGDDQTKAKYSLKRTPGLTSFASTFSGKGRGMYVPPTFRTTGLIENKMYFVVGRTLYKTDQNGTVSTIGNLNSVSSQVYFADNGPLVTRADFSIGGNILMLCDGSWAYYVDMATDAAVIPITEAAFRDVSTAPQRVVFNDGYFLVSNNLTQAVQISPQYYRPVSPTSDVWSAINYFEVQNSPDTNQAMVILGDQVWIFGTDSYEIWTDTGADIPYEFLQGSAHTIGAITRSSVESNGSNVFWLGSNARGFGRVFMNQGYGPVPISTQPMEEDIQKYNKDSIINAIGYCYQYGGRDTYQLTFGSGVEKTWCFDIGSGLWYRKSYLKNGIEKRHRTVRSEMFVEKTMVQDWETGEIYYYDNDNYTDNGDNIRRTRISPTMPSDNTRYFYPRFELIAQMGVGLATGTIIPKGMLQISNDGGRNFGKELWRSMGVSGAYEARFIMNQLGESRSRVWKFVYTEKTDITLMSATAKGISV